MTNENKPKEPSHDVFIVVGDTKESTWIKVGDVWPSRDGKGFNIFLNAVPTNGGRLVARPFNERAGGVDTRGSESPASSATSVPRRPAP